jgi:hypothetical protein
LHVVNIALETIERIAPDCSITAKMDSGRIVSFDPHARRHFDDQYAVIGHSNLGLTAGGVLIHMDLERALPGELLDNGMAYLPVSRAQFDLQVYTNDAKALGYGLSRNVSHSTANQRVPAEIRRVEPRAVSIATARGLSVG